MKTVIAIIILLLASITATVFSVREAKVELPPCETQSAVTQTVTEKETATEILSVTETETKTYEIESETVAPTAESEAETTTQKPATTKPITTITKITAAPSTTQAPVTTTKPTTATAPIITTTQPVTELVDIDIDYYINYAIEYGKSIGLEYDSSATACWDTPIGVTATNHDAVIRDIKDALNFYKNVEGDEYFCVWAKPYGNNQYELYIGYSN